MREDLVVNRRWKRGSTKSETHVHARGRIDEMRFLRVYVFQQVFRVAGLTEFYQVAIEAVYFEILRGCILVIGGKTYVE